MGMMKDYVESQPDLVQAYKTGGGNITPEQAEANRNAILISKNIDPQSIGIEEALEIVGNEHYERFGKKEIDLGLRTVGAAPTPITKEQIAEAVGPRTIEYTGGGSTTNIYEGEPIDYSRIQGFIGTPEVRDEEGNIVTEATGIYAQQPTGLMAAQEATQQAIGQATVDPDTGEATQPSTLFGGQAALGAGQAQLGVQLGAGQAGLMAGQQALGEGQSTIGQAIGVPDDKQPQTLFGGQMALGQGQQGIQTGVQGLGRDLGTLTGDLSAFEKASRAYQTRAEGQRAQGREIGMTTRDELEAQLRTVGSQTNRIAEQQAQQRQLGMMGPPPQAQQPPTMPQAQQATQAAQIAGQNLRSFAPARGGMMGPTGPVAVDPRDQVGFGPTRSPV